MPRIARELYDHGYYHVMTRGNNKRSLFCDEQDYVVFSNTIKKYIDTYDVRITNYCFMPNHVHLLIFVQKAQVLPKFMQVILQVYASYFRNKYKTVGFVFQNRYKSIFIKKSGYLLECARYIERNPIRSRLTDDLFGYRWCSFSFYATGARDDIIREINPMYLELAYGDEDRRRLYIKYVLEERPYENIVDKELKIG